MIRPNTYGMLRVSKPKAKRLYNSGMTVNIVPCNYSQDNGFMPLNPIPQNVDFEKYIRDFEVQCCTSIEIGKYPAFYVEDIYRKR